MINTEQQVPLLRLLTTLKPFNEQESKEEKSRETVATEERAKEKIEEIEKDLQIVKKQFEVLSEKYNEDVRGFLGIADLPNENGFEHELRSKGLTRKMLQFIRTRCLEMLQGEGVNPIRTFGAEIRCGEKQFIAQYKDKKMHVIMFSENSEIGFGATSTVKKVMDVTGCGFLAFKQVKPLETESIEVAIREFQMAQYERKKLAFSSHSFQKVVEEAEMLEEVHKHGVLGNIQEKPKMFVCVILDKTHFLMGHAGVLYREDLFDWLQKDKSIQRRLEVSEGLMKGAQNLIEKGFVHTDLKPENVCLDESGNPHLIDFESVENFNKNSSCKSISFTPGYMGVGDIEAIRATEKAGKILENRRAKERAMVFSAGLTIYRVLTKGWIPYESLPPPDIFKGHPDPEEPFNKKHLLNAGYLENEGADSRPTKVLRRMLSHNPETRMKSSDALKEWKNILRHGIN